MNFNRIAGKYSVTFAITLIMLTLCINVLAQDKNKGFNVGLVYPLSIQGIHSTEYSNVFSLNAFMGISGGEQGFSLSGFSNIVRGNVRGFQTSGFYTQISGDTRGFLLSGFMSKYQSATGFQAAGFLNLAKGNHVGTQLAGFMNTSSDVKGAQTAGFINIAHDTEGGQIAGFINIADEVEGAQAAGFINIARKVKGVQFAGFINIADSSDYPIAPINIIRNGEQWLGITIDENASTLAAFRSGSRVMYGIVGAGYNFRNEKKVITIQYGIGAHLLTHNTFRLNTEGTISHFVGEGSGEVFKASISVLPAIKLTRNVEFFAGPSLNYIRFSSTTDDDLVKNYIWKHNNSNGNSYGMYVGYNVGVHFALN